MYKRTTRTTVTSLLAVPLTAALAGPALAAPPDLRAEDGSRTVIGNIIYGQIEGRAGNIHELALAVHDVDGQHATGFLDSYACPDGVESPFDPSCEVTMWTSIRDGDFVATQAKDLSSATVVGDLGLLAWTCDDTGCSREPAGTISVDLSFTAVGDSVRSHETVVLRYPGARFVNIFGRHTQEGTASGIVGGAEVTHPFAFTETFRFRAVERVE
ncbi:hypothetical protein [Ornithinimicrobium cerasi]|uniref:Uncharacterized protein n=1 Tax=Ornithinimicrobium cerasi TaxID=2248773 RepID=A0A285VAY4_9MICO|nr:hypothetical protein [Ornithinimicrobium cerasi]SOC51249.1 hypothetical protein SAMN05421879_101102 [Ornithinimicrobium cerasi]